MKKILLSSTVALSLTLSAASQEVSPKEKAEALAKNEFSKSKQVTKQKYGVIKEKKMVIESTPVVMTDASFYQGNYVYGDLNYRLEIRIDAEKQIMATLTIGDSQKSVLKNVGINDAYFLATKINADGTEETWQGVFINKNDNGTTDFGLGIKLSKPVELGSLEITKMFFKKVSS